MEAWIGRVSNQFSKRACVAALLAGASLAGTAMGATGSTAPATTSTMTPAQVQAELQSLQAQVAALKAKEQKTSDSVESAAQVKAIVQEVLKNSKTQSQYMDNQLQAGYNNGFYIQTADKNFKFQFNGYFQYRYVFGAYQPQQAVGTPTPANGDANGFGFRYARLIFSGNVFSPRLTYFIQSDFAGGNGTSNQDFFAEKDLWVAYRFKKWLQVKAGSYLVPFTHVEYISSGLEMVDFNSVEWPFDPVRAMGASVFGDIIPNKFNYDFMINNGANTNTEHPLQVLGPAKIRLHAKIRNPCADFPPRRKAKTVIQRTAGWTTVGIGIGTVVDHEIIVELVWNNIAKHAGTHSPNR